MSPSEHQKFTRFTPITLMGVIALIGGIFFTVLSTQQNQDVRSKASTGINFLSNAGCEIGTNYFKGYQASISTVTTNPHSGSAACRIVSTGGSFYDMETFESIPNPQVGQTYIGAAYVRADSNTGKAVYVALRENGGNSQQRTIYGAPVYLTTSWQLVTNLITIQSSDRTSLDYYVIQDPGSSGQSFYVDDMAFNNANAATSTVDTSGTATTTTIDGIEYCISIFGIKIGNCTLPTPTPLPPTATPTQAPTATPTPTTVPSVLKVSVSPTSITPGGSVTVTWSGVVSPTANDWVGFVSASTILDNNPRAFTSSCTTTAGATAKASGTCTFAGPSAAGIYTVKLLADDSYVQLASGNTVTVSTAAVVTPTPTPTVAPGQPTPTTAPTATPAQPRPTLEPGATGVNFNLALHGLGKGGDSANPTGQGNLSPLHPQRTVVLDVYNSSNVLVKTQQSTVTYDSASGYFKGLVSLGTSVTNGSYTIRVKTDQFLRTLVPGIQNLTTGQALDLPLTSLVSGDINNDNSLNILDYNILMGCYSDLSPATNCPAGNELRADITDDGSVNQFDYNLFLRELTNRGGQ